MLLRHKILSLLAAISYALITWGQEVTFSGTQPVMYINTENSIPITSKEEYLQATYYLDPMGCEGIDALGSADNQLALEIRGRGNWTWNGFDKKPYRIKFASKTAIMGMNKSKHFALMANADDELSGLRNAVGYQLARMLDMPWTPTAKPVEVVLNGEYIGLYFLTETIRVDSDRVNIVEQADNETDPNAITGGWLVEIDNYDTDPHVRITEGNGERIIFTYKTPEELSAEQENFLREQMTAIDAAIYAEDKNSTTWEEYIDIDLLARFYIVQEILDNAESFHGSCYMYRDMGNEQKWKFGPVWDFGNTFRRDNGLFIYENPPYGQTWIAEIAKFPRFEEKVKEIWLSLREANFDDIYSFIDNYVTTYEAAIQADDRRWPDYGSMNVTKDGTTMKNNIRERADFLAQHWGDAEKKPSQTSYTAYFDPQGTDWEEIYAYSWVYNNTTTILLDDWPGRRINRTTLIDGVEYYTISFDPGYLLDNPMIIFNDGHSGVGEHQTEDLPLHNNGMYNINGFIGTHLATVTPIYNKRELIVDNRTIRYNGHITLYNMQGFAVVHGEGAITAPSAGIYIVAYNNTATKLSIP
ncbi:MAG: CotH kinase family protein [Muribaculaceae bacterium]|nr:CotH kinase family protein [Muribaculaceae bacterium]